MRAAAIGASTTLSDWERRRYRSCLEDLLTS